ncbi:hypothetical protein BGX27_005681 [Mortierella sp. AM989]|nr:hypothetical protein BGX27_005681 [Mortierella sp. AM989]
MSTLERTTFEALETAEILYIIGGFLDSCSIYNAILVSKFWYASLNQRLFSNLRISYDFKRADSTDSYLSIPPIELIRDNAHRIISLHIVSRPSRVPIAYFDIGGYTKLERLIWTRTKAPGNSTSSRQWKGFLEFLKANSPNLKEIVLQYSHVNIGSFWHILAGKSYSSLQHFSISSFCIKPAYLSWFWLACRNLVSLKLDNVSFDDCEMVPEYNNYDKVAMAMRKMLVNEEQSTGQVLLDQLESTVFEDRFDPRDNCLFPYLKQLSVLRLREPMAFLAEMLFGCPKLESFEWTMWHEKIRGRTGTSQSNLIRTSNLSDKSIHQPTESVMPWFKELPRKYLHIEEVLFRLYDPVYLQQGYTEPPRPAHWIRALRLPNITSVQTTLCALEACGQFSQLQDLDVSNGDLTSRDVLALLYSCPHLRSIAAPKIHAADVVATFDRPWVCLELESWNIAIESSLKAWRPSLSSPTPWPSFPLLPQGLIPPVTIYRQPRSRYLDGLIDEDIHHVCLEKLSSFTFAGWHVTGDI